jgi:CDP-diglyceride synthetase
MKNTRIPMLITYAIAHVLLFIAWAQLLYAGLFAENLTIYTVLAVVVGAALATIQVAAILQDIEHEREDAHDSN